MKHLLPHELPCFTTAKEQSEIASECFSQALATLLKEPVDPTVPDDPQLLANMKIWETQGREAWLKAELDRLESKDWSGK